MTRVSLELLKYLQGHITVSHVQGDRRRFLRELAAILTQFALADAISTLLLAAGTKLAHLQIQDGKVFVINFCSLI